MKVEKAAIHLSSSRINPNKEELQMTTIIYSVPGIHCTHCTHTIETEVGELEGVKSVKAEVDSKNVMITFDAPASEEKIKALLTEIKFPAAA
jgi:copper ion binding protein